MQRRFNPPTPPVKVKRIQLEEVPSHSGHFKTFVDQETGNQVVTATPVRKFAPKTDKHVLVPIDSVARSAGKQRAAQQSRSHSQSQKIREQALQRKQQKAGQPKVQSAGAKWLSKVLTKQCKRSVRDHRASSTVVPAKTTCDAAIQCELQPRIPLDFPRPPCPWKHNTWYAKLVRTARTAQWEVFENSLYRLQSQWIGSFHRKISRTLCSSCKPAVQEQYSAEQSSISKKIDSNLQSPAVARIREIVFSDKPSLW